MTMQMVAQYGCESAEHTMAALQRAFHTPSFDGVKVMVRLTGDRKLVLAQDDMIDDCVVRTCSLAQLREKRSELVTLEAVLELHKRYDKELFLELPHRDVMVPLVELLQAGAIKILLLSFDHDMIDSLHPQLPAVRMLYLLEDGDDVSAAVRRARRTDGVAGLGLDLRLLPQVRPEWQPLFPLWMCWGLHEYDTPQLLRHTRTNYPWIQRYVTNLWNH